MIQLLFYSLYTFYRACTNIAKLYSVIIISADTYNFFSFREHTTQQLQSRVSVTTTLDPPLPQQTITTLAPFSALPTSIHQHSLVSLPFSSWLFYTRFVVIQEEGEALSREKERVTSESSSKPITQYTLCCCSNACMQYNYSIWTFIHLNFNPLLSLVVGLVGELLSSTSTSYSESTTAPSHHPSPPHSTQWFNYCFTAFYIHFAACTNIVKLYSESADIFLFSGSILRSSYNLVWVWPQLWTHLYLSKPSRHWPLSALSQPASINTPWWACLFPVGYYTCFVVMQEEGETFSREKESMASESSSKTCMQSPTIYNLWLYRSTL